MTLLICVFQVNVSLFILHGVRVVALPQPLFVIQFLLQPLLPAQLLQRQPIKVRAPLRCRFSISETGLNATDAQAVLTFIPCGSHRKNDCCREPLSVGTKHVSFTSGCKGDRNNVNSVDMH